jgi:hypothetical protein
MTISRTTVDKLGIKMYDKASAVIAELVANSYDADAVDVTITVPLNKWLATKRKGRTRDRGFEIIVKDDGHGMTPNVINDFYLKVGSDPRIDPRRGPKSLEKGRPRMGRKGIGKLAPFGICKVIEVISSGGKKTPEGYETAHFILEYKKILKDTDAPYKPKKGKLDGTFSQDRGTTIVLKKFNRRRTPDRETFDRQLSRRFGLRLPDFQVKIINSAAEEGEEKEWILGELDLEINEDTLVDLKDLGKSIEDDKGEKYELPVITLEDGSVLPVTGWIAYSKKSYKNEEMAGIRIYARGKIVSTTRDFGVTSGFTGEFKMRSYLIGEIHADWIDEDEGEDLIRSDRQDILWVSDMGNAFRKWGHEILKIIAKRSRTPMRQIARRKFMEKSNLEEEAKERYKDRRVVDAAVQVGRVIGAIASLDDLDDEEYVSDLKELVLTVAPHKMLVDSLRKIGDEDTRQPLDLIVKLFNDAKVAEMASLGQIAYERLEAIEKLEKLISPSETSNERELQKLIEGTPWLIAPYWTVLQANKSFKNVRKAFETWYEKEHGRKINTSAIESDRKRPDFVMLNIGNSIEVVEIKDVDHVLSDKEFNRVTDYYSAILKFQEENSSIRDQFPYVHITIICDKVDLKESNNNIAYDSLYEDKKLKKRTWLEVLTDVRNAHMDFLEM